MPYDLDDAGDQLHALELHIPHVAIHFCTSSVEFEQSVRAAIGDRRMFRAKTRVQDGGISAAIQFYQDAASPDLLVLECDGDPDETIRKLNELADVCSAETNVVVIGRVNEVGFYRRLVENGVRDYAVAPIQPLELIHIIAKIFANPQQTLGRSIAFVGATGGAGSSAIAHNVASRLGRKLDAKVILADMDLCFGSAAITFDASPVSGVGQALESAERLDTVLLERLLTDCGEHLSLLASPASLANLAQPDDGGMKRILEAALASAPFVVLDLPHVWTDWAKIALVSADEVVVVAEPTLVSIRNAKQIADAIRAARPNDATPRMVLNQVGVRRRLEVAPAKCAELLGSPVTTAIPYDAALFSAEQCEGAPIVDRWPRSEVARRIEAVVDAVSGRRSAHRKKAGLLSFLRRA